MSFSVVKTFMSVIPHWERSETQIMFSGLALGLHASIAGLEHSDEFSFFTRVASTKEDEFRKPHTLKLPKSLITMGGYPSFS